MPAVTMGDSNVVLILFAKVSEMGLTSVLLSAQAIFPVQVLGRAWPCWLCMDLHSGRAFCGVMIRNVLTNNLGFKASSSSTLLALPTHNVC